MTPKKITWADAEQIYPGIEAEWRSMCGAEGTCVPPTNEEWRLELAEWPTGKVIYVIQLDPLGKWRLPPEWRRWPSGGWTNPLPLPFMPYFDSLIYNS